jgi:hypothetical protein
MRKIIVLEHISLDGVIQAPGGPGEDTSDGFPYGGWAGPYWAHVRRKYYDLQLSILSARADYRMNGPALSPPSNSRMD